MKCRIDNLEEIPLVNGSPVADHVQKNDAIFSELMKRCSYMEVYAFHDVIISDSEKD